VLWTDKFPLSVAGSILQLPSLWTGLDEFDGRPAALISLLQEVKGFLHVKLCVASRPWVEFQEASQHKPSLQLKHITKNDIMVYVSSKFHDDPMFSQLQIRYGRENFLNS
jgi:hypothetical protein